MNSISKIIFTIFVLTSAFQLGGLQASESKSIPVLSQPLKISYTEFHPFTFTNEKGQKSGYLLDIIRAILDADNVPYNISVRPTSRTYHQLMVGEVDIWAGAAGVPLLKNHVEEVILPDPLSISLYLWRMPKTLPAPELNDLANMNITVISGFTYKGVIEILEDPARNILIHRSHSHNSALKMLITKRSDYVLDYKSPMENSLKQFPEVKLAKQLIQKRRLGFIVSKKAQQAEKVIQYLEVALKDLPLQDIMTPQ